MLRRALDFINRRQLDPALTNPGFRRADRVQERGDAATGTVAYEIPDPSFSWRGWSMDMAPVLGEQNDVASACCFLLAPASRWITGTTLTVEGSLASNEVEIAGQFLRLEVESLLQFHDAANAVAPGVVLTDRVRCLVRDDDPLINKSLLGAGEPEDVAQMALFLASDESARITGAILPVKMLSP